MTSGEKTVMPALAIRDSRAWNANRRRGRGGYSKMRPRKWLMTMCDRLENPRVLDNYAISFATQVSLPGLTRCTYVFSRPGKEIHLRKATLLLALSVAPRGEHSRAAKLQRVGKCDTV